MSCLLSVVAFLVSELTACIRALLVNMVTTQCNILEDSHLQLINDLDSSVG
jgi:hypothetical protein